jgi:hypothetical protein
VGSIVLQISQQWGFSPPRSRAQAKKPDSSVREPAFVVVGSVRPGFEPSPEQGRVPGRSNTIVRQAARMTRRRRSSGLSDDVRRFQPLRRYFFLPDAKLGCHPAVFWLGAAAIVLIFSFFGFLASRLPFCSPLAMSISLGLVRMQSLIGGWASVAVSGI